MRILLLRPPRFLWPFNSETSAFWQPLGLLCLAGMVRRHLPQAQVEVWDAPACQWGWRTLEQKLKERPIDVLGIGEETVSAHEALRAARLVKELYPDCVVVAGGAYFPYAIEQTLSPACTCGASPCPCGAEVDVIVRGEGEHTFVQLLQNLHDRPRWRQIPGLAFRGDDGRPVVTGWRPLIEDLDALPPPAYDLLDMARYGQGSHNHPNLVSIEHSRGCIDACSFCILWKHMGQRTDGNGTIHPRYRTKSPQRSFEEVRWLYHRFGRRTFGWVDPTFNASPDWSDPWAELMLRSELAGPRGRNKTLHTAWLRADCLIRDHRLGIMKKLVRAGLRQVMIGVERDDPTGLDALGKHTNDGQITREAFAILRQHYPQVYTIGTMIFGLPGDTEQDLVRLMRYQYEVDMDYCFLMPLTPNPGTAAAQQSAAGGYIVNRDLASYNFHTPVCRTDTLSLRELEAMYWRLMFQPDRRRLDWMLRALLLERDRRKRRVHLALFAKGLSIAAQSLLRRLLRPGDDRPALYSRRPRWYDT